ncbi:hypothetical protein [Legionella septentrionalis]|uniref:Uncharacterized protein n=1 Tax=Legionella septentrionalis TaxID=2498109 RepID=A0A433JL42_9GAMM|nr:hypothetical protein [Legionella septentrionalis]RUQ89510.1 hypothetical protein EKM59_03680 [Legionella septentrionalis]RUQ93508.1 hypothetical protein ELY11_11760 [Legionella septentrionalis]
MKRCMIGLVLAFAVSACAPTYFGLSKEQWQSLTPGQQAQVIRSYNEREAERQRAENDRAIIAEQNAPLNNLIGALGSSVPHHEHGKSKTITTSSQNCTADGSQCTSTSTSRSSGWRVGN